MFPHLDQCSEEERVQRLLELKLRCFTPREVANLMGFPPSFCKPPLSSSLLPLKARAGFVCWSSSSRSRNSQV